MYSRQEASQIRQQFYTRLGQYMAPILSASGERQNWLNYKTGIRHIYIRMDTPNRGASIGFTLAHPDRAIRLEQFEKFSQVKALLQSAAEVLPEPVELNWNWERETFNETGQVISRIYEALPGKSVLNQNDWPDLISFFKPRLITLDQFWNDVKFQFET